MKFAVLAALFAAVSAAEEVTVALPFSLDQLALMVAKQGKPRFDLYQTMLVEAWKAEDLKTSTTRADTYYTDHTTKTDKWAADIVAAAGLKGDKLEALWNELWEQRLKLDVQARESEKLTKSIADEIVAANPSIKDTLKTDADLKSFTDAVSTMGTKLVDAQQKKAEQATLDKAEAGIFDLSAEQQAEFDKTQLELTQAAQAKAKEQAEAAVKEMEAAKAAGTFVASTLTVAEKIAAMQTANDKAVENTEAATKAAKAQLNELKKLGLFASGADALTDEEKKALVAKQKAAAEAAALAANPVKGKDGFPCYQYKDGKDEDGNDVFKRATCAEKYCCGTAWSKDVDEDDSLVEGFFVADDATKQRLEVCGLAKMDDPDGDKADDGTPEQVDNDKFQHTIIKNNIPVQVELQFACITGAKALAAGAAAVLSAFAAM